MDVQSALFYLFATLLVFAAFRVVTVRNPVYAALYLILAFFQAAGLWMLLQAEFLSITLVLVYVGAVMVLFLFVIMMLDINADTLRQHFWRHFPLAALVGGIIIVQMAMVFMGTFDAVREAAPMRAADGLVLPVQASNTTELGKLLYTQYLFPIEIAAVLLLVAIITAIALTLRHRKDSKFQAASEQVRVKPADRVRIVQMKPTQPAPSADMSTNAAPEEKQA